MFGLAGFESLEIRSFQQIENECLGPRWRIYHLRGKIDYQHSYKSMIDLNCPMCNFDCWQLELDQSLCCIEATLTKMFIIEKKLINFKIFFKFN